MVAAVSNLRGALRFCTDTDAASTGRFLEIDNGLRAGSRNRNVATAVRRGANSTLACICLRVGVRVFTLALVVSAGNVAGASMM